ncbi:MAG: response regulator transcription factor [Saprospirales bacterium]|nr:response regulator transcription factor [Saprospirales bacterium]
MRALLVDDEFLALQLVERFLLQAPDIVVIGKCRSALEAREKLKTGEVDLLFLDIQMPALSGTNLLKSLPNPPVTIFTTAYAEYAAEAFDLNAVDYLLKPFSMSRFQQALEKAREQLLLRGFSGRPPDEARDFMVVRADGAWRKVFYRDMIYIEGMKEYVRMHCRDQRLIILESLQNLESQLPTGQFLRVHKSYIVALKEVLSVKGYFLSLRQGGRELPISRGKRREVLKLTFD